jgi:citrate synthase
VGDFQEVGDFLEARSSSKTKEKESVMSTAANVQAGLEGIVAAQTRLSHVDGQRGELILAGFPIEQLAPRATFEEVVHLLWHDRLPDAQELAALREALASRRNLPCATLDLLAAAAREQLPPMDALRMAAGTLDLQLPADERSDRGLALALLARLPTAAAAYWRLRKGCEPVAPDPSLGHAANYAVR